jgi:lipopolysaccharide/colanic/teichoic acid biosynthesis glycosyltransferase
MSRQLPERVLAALGLLVASPLLALCAAAIYCEDRGPIFFRQRRIGVNGKPFILLKLRSMQSLSHGKSITAGGDSRITVVGKLLRDYKLDELPQLWNVCRGEMCFIGPRPEVPEYVDLTNPGWRAVLSVPPGITDLASLVFRHEERLLSGRKDVESFYREWLLPKKLDISEHYLRIRNAATDARLIALTLRVVFLGGQINQDQIARQFSYTGRLTCTK